MSTLRVTMSMALALAAGAPCIVDSRAGSQTPTASLRSPTLREVLAAYDVPLGPTAPRDLDQRILNYAVEDATDLFVIGFVPRPAVLPETLRVSAFDRGTRTWSHATLEQRRRAAPAWDVGSILRIHHTNRHVLLDTHVSPSAGTVIVLSRTLAPVATLSGWVLRVLPSNVVLYHRSSVHFAPTHAVELWTWDGVTGRDALLYPGTPPDSVRRAYVDTVRAIYRRVGVAWFRTNNHHMDAERFDSRLRDSIVVGATGRTLAFLVRFGGGDGTPAATPPVDVVVHCREVGSERGRCTEQPLSTLERQHPGWHAHQILNDLVGNPPYREERTVRRAVTLDPLVGARVRFRAGAGSPWRHGMLNRTRTEPGCFMVLLWANGVFRTQIPVDSLASLQVSSLYARSRRYEESDTTLEAGEAWLEVPAETVRAAATLCVRRAR